MSGRLDLRGVHHRLSHTRRETKDRPQAGSVRKSTWWAGTVKCTREGSVEYDPKSEGRTTVVPVQNRSPLIVTQL